jgi:hypothetical protein
MEIAESQSSQVKIKRAQENNYRRNFSNLLLLGLKQEEIIRSSYSNNIFFRVPS